MPKLSLGQKRIGSAILAVAILLSGLSWLLELRFFGRFDAVVFALLIMITVIYVYVVPPKLGELEEGQDR